MLAVRQNAPHPLGSAAGVEPGKKAGAGARRRGTDVKLNDLLRVADVGMQAEVVDQDKSRLRGSAAALLTHLRDEMLQSEIEGIDTHEGALLI